MDRSTNLNTFEMQIKRAVLEVEGVKRIQAYHTEFNPNSRQFTVFIEYLDIYDKSHQTSYRKEER